MGQVVQSVSTAYQEHGGVFCFFFFSFFFPVVTLLSSVCTAILVRIPKQFVWFLSLVLHSFLVSACDRCVSLFCQAYFDFLVQRQT